MFRISREQLVAQRKSDEMIIGRGLRWRIDGLEQLKASRPYAYALGYCSQQSSTQPQEPSISTRENVPQLK